MDDLASLRLQIEWGADEALQDTPRNRFAPAPVPAATPAPAATLWRSTPAPLAAPAAIPAATLAAAAPDLQSLHAALDAFQDCPLRATASTTVAPSGNPAAGLVLVSEAPGPDDDRAGIAFSGPAGATLDRLLATAGLSRADLLLVPMIPWRPPGGRPVNETEVALCLPFLHRILALTRPSHLVLLGTGPWRALADPALPVRKARGQWTPVMLPGQAGPVLAMPMLAPDLWLSSPVAKQSTWSDLLAIRQRLAIHT